jgi:hypothetical protein
VPNPLAELLLDVELLVPVELAALVFVFAAADCVFFATGMSEFNTVGIV